MKIRRAFSLVELLTAIGILSVLIGLLMPTMGRARESARRAMCASNLRQLHIASVAYATDNRGYFPPAHLNFITKQLHRWHGTRTADDQPFDFAGSPLKKYLQVNAIKQCPSFVPSPAGFEASAGGYGYNNRYIGSSMDSASGSMSIFKLEANYLNVPAKISMIASPGQTVMFTDAAMADNGMIEYSFVEAPINSYAMPTSPSIHFRHAGFANAVWVDGHVSAQSMDWTYPINDYGADNAQARLGYFGPKDNTLFDRR